jgi:hypothetical protein
MPIKFRLPVIEVQWERPAWWSQAACHGLTDLFYASDLVSVRTAQAICARCPVRVPCAVETMVVERSGDRFGVRGGLSATERDRLTPGRPRRRSGRAMIG